MTTRRCQQIREAPDVAAGVRRMVRALVRRATAGELEALEELASLQRDLRRAIHDASQGAHDGPAAYSWTEIAAVLTVSRQAARQRAKRLAAKDPQ